MPRRTSSDLALLAFLATAALGAGLAYDPGPAWAKFGRLAGAVAVYYLAAWQPARRRGWLAGALGGLGAGLGAYFLLTHDWRAQPADFGWLNDWGLAWMSVRPALPGYLHPNAAGGMLAMLLPFPLAQAWRAVRDRRWPALAWAAGAGAVIALGLLLTSSRGAWLALAAGLGAWAAGAAGSRLAAGLGRGRGLVIASVIGLLCLGALAFVRGYPGGLVGLADHLPGLPSGASRWELNVNTFQLAQDYWLTGGGLRAFEGLYSRYARLIQVPQFTYSHSLYLDVWLEQGLLGLVALLTPYLVSLARLADARQGDHALRGATLAGLLVVLGHGLFDDALYGNAGTSWVFLLPGAAVALTEGRSAPLAGRRWALAAASLALLGGGWLFTPAARASVWANLGAAPLARAELAGWPERINAGSAPAGAGAALQRALALDPANRTAALRLGLLAEARDDYAAAAALLEPARPAGLALPAFRKALGYAYLWTGRAAEAGPLLATLPEAPVELFEYARWWRAQGRPERAAQADQMRAWLVARGDKTPRTPMAAGGGN